MALHHMNLVANFDKTEEEILSGIPAGETLEFFQATHVGCFKNIQFYGQHPVTQVQQEINAVLDKYGIEYGNWERISTPIDGGELIRFTNGVIHMEVKLWEGATLL